MAEQKRKRGRPKLPTPITEDYAPSRRQAVNAMYMYNAVDLITEAASEIPNADLLWFADDQTRTAKSKSGVLEQIGRMLIQDRFSSADCIYIAGLAADAVSAGYTSREVENAILPQDDYGAGVKDPEDRLQCPQDLPAPVCGGDAHRLEGEAG